MSNDKVANITRKKKRPRNESKQSRCKTGLMMMMMTGLGGMDWEVGVAVRYRRMKKGRESGAAKGARSLFWFDRFKEMPICR